MGSSAKRRTLFRSGARALRAVTDHAEEDLYACPLCQRIFAAQAIEGPDPPLTYEHVPPQKLGGRAILLTCKRCNSEGGEKLDAQTIARRQLTEAMRALVDGVGTYDGRGVVHIAGQRLAGDLIVRRTNVRLNVTSKATDPRAGSKARTEAADLEARGKGIQIKVTPEVQFRPRESQLGDLRSAYLAAFAVLGYTYGFDRRLEPVREQILNPKLDLISWVFWAADRQASPDVRRMLLFEAARVLLVQLGQAWVILPCPGSPPDATQRARQLMRGDTIRCHDLGWPEQLRLTLDLEHRARGSPPLFRLVSEPAP